MNIYLKKFIKDKEKGKALDLGAGEYFDVACIRQLGWECDGVDLKDGVDLNKLYFSPNMPYDLIYSNYVIHLLENKENFVNSIYNNLKEGGYFFIHTFHALDKNSKSELEESDLLELFKKFKNLEIELIDYYDNDIGHNHWHKILQITGEK